MHPLKVPYITSQNFGGNGEYYRTNGIDVLGHNGIDMVGNLGDPVYAAHDGTCYTEIDSSGGNGVVIRSLVPYEYEGKEVYMKTIYWHLINSDAVVKDGQVVKAGELIGYAGSTGFSSSPHLHFGLKPQAWSESSWTWWNAEQNNGYGGAIDPASYLPQKPMAYTKDLQRGSVGADVKKLQEFLVGQNLLVTGIYGYFGPKTLAAVKAFQKQYGINPTGYVGPITRAKLNSFYGR